MSNKPDIDKGGLTAMILGAVVILLNLGLFVWLFASRGNPFAFVNLFIALYGAHTLGKAFVLKIHRKFE